MQDPTPAAELVEIGSAAWYIVLLLAGLAIGVAIAIAQKVREK